VLVRASLNSRHAVELVRAEHARCPHLREVAFHLSHLPSKKRNLRVEALQPDYIASTAGCFSNEPEFVIELCGLANEAPGRGLTRDELDIAAANAQIGKVAVGQAGELAH
jgi:hypothetical protein